MTSDNYISDLYKLLPTTNNKSTERQDNDSINTMDYYIGDELSSKKLEFVQDEKTPNKYGTKKIDKNEDSIRRKHSTNNSDPNDKKNGNISNEDINENGLGIYPYIQKMKNVRKRFKSNTIIEKNNNSFSNAKIQDLTKASPNGSNPICIKCLNSFCIRNLDNNSDSENLEQNFKNEKICPNCRNIQYPNDNYIPNSRRKSLHIFKSRQPIDAVKEMAPQDIKENKEENNLMFNYLDSKYNEYDLLMKKIQEKKRELEIKVRVYLNTLQLIQKGIECDYKLQLTKLNEMGLKLQYIINTINDKKNESNSSHNNYNDNTNFEKIIQHFKSSMNDVSKNFEKLSQKINSKLNPKAFKIYESKQLLINLSDTYYMKPKEILSNNSFGTAKIKVDRFVNSYTNYINFSILITKNHSSTNNKVKNNVNHSLKSNLVLYLVINNRIIKMNKTNKENDSNYINYHCSLKESNVFPSKNTPNQSNNTNKEDEFKVQLLISELSL